MRISTAQLFQMGIKSVLDQQNDLTRLQTQIASGKRIENPSEDPAGAVRILDLRQAIETTTQYQENINMVRQRLSQEDTTLNSLGDVLQRVRELAVQGNNDTLTAADRGSIAVEVRQRLDDMLALANTRDANGEYLFSGFRSNTKPFSAQVDGSYLYHGDQGQRFLQVSPTRQVADRDSGSAIFMDIPTGNGTFQVDYNTANTGTGIIDQGTVTNPAAWDGDSYRIVLTNASATPGAPADTFTVLDSANNVEATGAYVEGAVITFNGIETNIIGEPQHNDEFTVSPSVKQNLFETVQNLAVAMESGALGPDQRAALHNEVNRVLIDLLRVEDSILETRAGVGARLNAAESQENINEDFSLNLSRTLSSVEDLDLAEAVSQLQQKLAGLEAAQAAFVRVQGLSLFDYIR